MRKSKKSTYRELYSTNPSKARRIGLYELYERKNILTSIMKKENTRILKKEGR